MLSPKMPAARPEGAAASTELERISRDNSHSQLRHSMDMLRSSLEGTSTLTRQRSRYASVVMVPTIDLEPDDQFAEVDPIFRNLAIEAMGTSLIVLVATTYHPNSALAVFGPLAGAAAVTLVVWIGAPLSGAHYNPALTMAFLSSRLFFKETLGVCYFVGYMTVQILCGCMAAAVSYGLSGHESGLPKDPQVWEEYLRCFFGELLGTFLFCCLVLYVATNPNAGTFAPVAVGLGVYAVIMSFVDVSGAVINPAVASGMFLMGAIHDTHGRFSVFMLYVVAEILGGICAGLVTKMRLPASDKGPLVQEMGTDTGNDERKQVV